MPKRKIFVSHVNQEAELAALLKGFLQSAFAELSVFVSSDPDDLPLGKKWLEVISAELRGCVAELVLCSPQSVGRPWVNFELGAGWARAAEDLPIIPLCHSGLTKGNLPQPLGALQAADLNDAEGIKKLVHAIAAGLGEKVPKVDAEAFADRVTAFESRYTLWDGLVTSLGQLDNRLRSNIRAGTSYEFGLTNRDEQRIMANMERLEQIGLVRVESKGAGVQQSPQGGPMTSISIYVAHPGPRHRELVADERYPI